MLCFYSREMAKNSWECRDINVILQELEKFSGVMVLTTNRKVQLDPALERRIALKVDFGMPDEGRTLRNMAKPSFHQKHPLAKDVNFEHLAKEYAVSGGIIKNAALHAARYAAYREKKHICMSDFIHGIEMELESSWKKKFGKIGFTGKKLAIKGKPEN